MTLWTATDAATATGGTAIGDWAVSGFSIDTRTLRPGDLFVALKAARDGHDFVGQALEKGAGAALVSHVPEGCEDGPLLLVDDVQAALEALGRAGRARSRAKVVAITGSVGKTSTKEMLRHVLAPQGKTHAAIKSFNNHWGVPLTLAALPVDTDYAVIEIGMNHPGEIAPLAAQAAPHVAMVTTVAPVHLEAFADGVPGIAREKAAIFSGLVPGGAAIWNADLDVSEILAEQGTVSFGRADADWSLTEVVAGADGTACAAATPVGDLMFRIGAPGAHFALNALAVLAAVHAVGADVPQAALALADWTPPEGRGQRHAVALHPDHPPVDVIDDAYNANPASVGAALALLAGTEVPRRARRIAILGDMKELGPTGPALHAALADHGGVAGLDQIHTVGPLMKHLHETLPPAQRGHHTDTSEAMAAHLRDMVAPGDAVMVKGSLSMNMAVLVTGLRALGDGQG
ncbi:UDP-N-acetylmuramoyl-tripeptide--D-alanyl-D-alanine ligase [Jannaschia pagri]|uniref:UDP-N-acetylmuramoyl-tripeptide--D-alanyl-D-alanine ligase n=1 Tax=Jannaschia pagri TaxID=2829797 RepID=A0ABQ4NJ48_9RHOB|nr:MULTISPECIES: UDP-N-acetylmuramoyl-tripeptide--D-alanyl-D-alanine ligase [unclassified Jannaschia]GIT90617.1 UDP-N-acetylmuramoyl-tripeptide--D-alanyl-D-alanine ligase [Jannaschia sp. AI_61]GIT94449.1 UDP-N-acetylmuramoyl-tripeptide--D-alanyl-D-alanine ligase [Jannaschia sp. AI_62]